MNIKGYVNKISVLKQLVEKYAGKRKEMYEGFNNLENGYNKVYREKLWKALY